MTKSSSPFKSKKPGPPQPVADNFLLLHPSSLIQELRAVFFFLLILLVFRLPALFQLSSAYLGGSQGDPGLYIWLTKSNARDLFSLPWFNTLALYPYTRSLAWSDNFILPALVMRPLMALGLSHIAAWNLLLFSVIFLNGYLTYRLCFRLCGNALTAFTSGAAFMSLSCFSANLGHPQLQFFFWIPAALLSFFRFLAAPAWRPAFFTGLAIFASFLCCIHYSVFIAVLIFAILAAFVLQKPARFNARCFMLLTLGLAAGLAPVIFFLRPYLDARAVFGARAIYEAHYFSATAASYLAASPLSLLYNRTAGLSHEEAYLFPGLLISILVVLAYLRLTDTRRLKKASLVFAACFAAACLFSLDFWHRITDPPAVWPNYACALALWATLASFAYVIYRLGCLERAAGFNIMTNRGLIGAFLMAALLFWVLSMGPQGNPNKGHLALAPYRVLYELLPGFNSIRAISRSGLVCLFCFCAAASIVMTFLQSRKVWGRLGIVTVLAGILVENVNRDLALLAPAPRPAVFSHLMQLSDHDHALVVLPWTKELKANGQVKSWGDFAVNNVNFMNWTFPLRRPLVNGYSGQRTKLMTDSPRRTMLFPDQLSLQELGRIAGLRYIVYLSALRPHFNATAFLRQAASLAPQLNYLYGDNEGNYLFEFLPVRRVNENGFFLMAPSYPEGVLSLELKATYRPSLPQIALRIFDEERAAAAPLATIKIIPEDSWKIFELCLPASKDRVRPQRLVFKSEPPDAPVYLRNSTYHTAAKCSPGLLTGDEP